MRCPVCENKVNADDNYRSREDSEDVKKGPIQLQIKESNGGGYEIWLDDKKLHHVKNYKIESSPMRNRAELSVTMLVMYPVNQESASKQPLLQLQEE